MEKFIQRPREYFFERIRGLPIFLCEFSFPHSLNNRPLVVPGGDEIRIVIGSDTQMKAKVSFDSHLEFQIEPGESLIIRKKKERLLLVHPPGHSFYGVCRSKLDWASRGTYSSST